MRERVLVKEPLPIARIDIELVRDASIDNEADVRAPLVDQPLEDDTPALLVMPSVLLVQQNRVDPECKLGSRPCEEQLCCSSMSP